MSPNREVLEAVAELIRPLLDEVVFVGGQVTELLITEPHAVRVRPTVDVDVVVSAMSRLEYHRMGERLREFGFVNDTREMAPICRWLSSEGHVLDLMPVDETILGFSNRWYAAAVETATPFTLDEYTSDSDSNRTPVCRVKA